MAVIVAVVLLVLVGALVLQVAHVATQQLTRTRYRGFAAQSQLLADSGLERALARVRGDKIYLGETWSIPPQELNSRYAAQVTIRVDSAPNPDNPASIVVVAEYPMASTRKVTTRIAWKPRTEEDLP